MPQRTIFHVDVNSAFLSWKAVYQIREQGSLVDLREIPSAIGGDEDKRHGIVLAKSIPARKYGVRTGSRSFSHAKNVRNWSWSRRISPSM